MVKACEADERRDVNRRDLIIGQRSEFYAMNYESRRLCRRFSIQIVQRCEAAECGGNSSEAVAAEVSMHASEVTTLLHPGTYKFVSSGILLLNT